MTRWLKWIKADSDEKRKEISKGDEDMEFAQRMAEAFKGIWPTTEEEYYEFRLKEEVASAKYRFKDETALAMLKNNESIEKVILYSGLSEQEILAIAKENDIKIDTE